MRSPAAAIASCACAKAASMANARAGSSKASALAYALRRLRRGWRSGELLILVLALAVAVAALSAVSLFTERVRTAIENQSGEALGADLLLRARQPLPPTLEAAATAAGARSARTVQLASVVLAGEASALASIKSVGAGYPLRGQLQISDEPFGAARPATTLPAAGEAWVDARLWQDLNLARGATLQVGALTLRVAAVLENEPDRGNGFADLAPRLMMALDDLPASALLGPGARVQYSLLLAGSATELQPALSLTPPSGVRRLTPGEARPEIRAAIARASEFLDVAVLATTLLAAAAIALCAHQHGGRLRDEVALLKCLGARHGFITRALLLNLLLLGLAGSLLGAGVGLLAQAGVVQLLGGLLQIELPPTPLWALLPAIGLGVLVLLGFGLPPLLQARAAPPLRVFQRDTRPQPLSWGLWLAASATVVALLWIQTGQPELARAVLLGAGATVASLGALGWLLVRLLTPMRRAVGLSWRFGLGNVARRRGGSVAQIVALGLALLALLLVSVVRQDLLQSWQARLPADAPNQFLINIQPAQQAALQDFFHEHAYPDQQLWPMARARLVAFNGEAVTPDSFSDPETQRWINRDFNLSWTTALNPDNRITGGQWWGAAGRGQRLISADKYAVERLGLKLGDRLTLDFAGEPVEFTVSSLRTVDWDSFRPNFFLLIPPGVVRDDQAQYIASFHLPRANRGLLRALITRFPNVTVLDIESALNQVRAIVDRVVQAVELILLFALAAGLTVLLATIEGTRAERVRETGLLRALGASSATITRGLLAEYAVLGALAGLVAASAAQGVAWLLATRVLKIDYGLRPLIWLAGSGGGALLVMTLGWLSLRPVLRTPPRVVLNAGP